MGAEATIFGDADIRPALRSNLLNKHADQPNTAIFEELGICRGRVRVDVAVVNGTLHGYEIKSDRDSLRRLDIQADFYGKVLDRATLVVGEHHLSDALDLLPAWWGVLLIHPTASVRHGRKNPRKDPRSLVEFLWLEDALALLEKRNIARGVRGKPRRFAWDRICEHFSVDEIAAAVRARLKTRAAMQAPEEPSKCGG
jgi:hypothetical protein